MDFDFTCWTRLPAPDGTPLFVRGADATWFVPNDAADRLLCAGLETGTAPEGFEAEGLLNRLPQGRGHGYKGRASLLELGELTELWIHATDRCNLGCRHCLFSCNKSSGRDLSRKTISTVATQAHGLGCRVFVLTGGEPLLHESFAPVLDELRGFSESHLVLLTNGILIPEHERTLRQWSDERLHFQLSLDGVEETHDMARGRGDHARTLECLGRIRDWGFGVTASMAVSSTNALEITRVVEDAAKVGVTNVHLLWHLQRGRGKAVDHAPAGRVFESIQAASAHGAGLGVTIDNVEAIRNQVFAPNGTIHDGTNAGWESVALGADGRVYPTPAMVGIEELASELDGDLESCWRHSPVLSKLRAMTAKDTRSPLRFLTGGGDPDHRLIAGGSFDLGTDPHLPLIERLALWQIATRAQAQPRGGPPGLRLKRGDVLESCGAHGAVALTHSNCLLSVSANDSRAPIRELYSRAAEAPAEDILNPVSYPEDLVSHVPKEARMRSYGCGSPVVDAGLDRGETLLDLGCGTGVECMIASRAVGKEGKVYGVDMLAPMLERARRASDAVGQRLGYRNVEIRRGYLEELPVGDGEVDVVISNCVINLSVDKRRTFGEVLRVLRPGGRLVVSDVVCETEPPPAIRNDDQLKGECIGGALTQRDLFGLLRETGFIGARVLRRFPYRTVQGHPFFSMTFEARRPGLRDEISVMYRGPFESVVSASGVRLFAGQTARLPAEEVDDLGQSLFVLDEAGMVENLDLGESACCSAAPDTAEGCCGGSTAPQSVGCMVCGSELEYLESPRTMSCVFCGSVSATEARCLGEEPHFVCDRCHSADALTAIERLCQTSTTVDMVELFLQVRKHAAVHVHGPEHHALIPAIIVAGYRNVGGAVADDALRKAIDRGALVPGGFCGLAGSCGAAIGVGIGFSVLLGATPFDGPGRQKAQSATAAALAAVTEYEAPRCCQRDGWLSLRSAAETSKGLLEMPLRADKRITCSQVKLNKECIRKACPLFGKGS